MICEEVSVVGVGSEGRIFGVVGHHVAAHPGLDSAAAKVVLVPPITSWTVPPIVPIKSLNWGLTGEEMDI